jgi:hypothetical protein
VGSSEKATQAVDAAPIDAKHGASTRCIVCIHIISSTSSTSSTSTHLEHRDGRGRAAACACSYEGNLTTIVTVCANSSRDAAR